MRKKYLIPILLLTFILAISAVSATENATDSVDDADEGVADELKAIDETSNIENQISSEGNQDSVNQISDDVLGVDSNSSTVKSKSAISTSKPTGYSSFNTKFVARLTIDGKVAPGKKLIINVNKKNYSRQTNANGQAILNINLPKGIYNAKVTYAGDENTTSATKTGKITVKESTKTKLLADNYLNFRQGSRSIFYVKLVNQKGKAIKSHVVTFKVAGKTYNSKTNANGYAKIYLNLKKGTYNIYCSFSKKQPYLSCKKTVKIVVRAKMDKGNGYWMWPMHMSSTSLKDLADKGTKHIFLLGDAVNSYGRSYVESWIRTAHSYGMKVHLWILVCCDGEDWVSPVRDDGSFKYGFINEKVNEAKYYAGIKGVDGIHLDYMRYGGTAHKHINAVESINYIVKKISYAVHKIKPNAIVSIAIMPEPDMMLYYYGQHVPSLSKYVDALLPMAYKSAYGKNTNWIKSVTKTFVKQSNGAQIWTGIESYHSEENPSPLSYNALMKDAKYAMAGGAKGVVLFRIGITHYLNFNRV